MMRTRLARLFCCLLSFAPLPLAARAESPGSAKPAPRQPAAAAKTLEVKPVDGKAAPKGDAPKAEDRFIRVSRDGKGEPLALETVIARYAPAKPGKPGEVGVTVDLIGAVHVGEKAYYERLNKEFEQYDVLLYELVAPPGTRIPKGGKRDGGSNPIAMLQSGLKSVLALESQLELVDYTRKNFVHADLSPAQLAETVRKRGETGMSLFFSIAGDMMREASRREQAQAKAGAAAEEDLDPLALLFDPAVSVKLKRLMAGQFEQLGNGTGLGDTLNTILVTDRNKAAVEVLKAEIGKGRKKIGIFYGAAHLPDFDRRLRDQLGLSRQDDRWLTAWDLTVKRGGGGLGDILKMLDR